MKKKNHLDHFLKIYLSIINIAIKFLPDRDYSLGWKINQFVHIDQITILNDQSSKR
jgi:hypothetical protein